MKVIIDTNILIDASADEYSKSNQIIREVIEGRIEAFATYQTMQENVLLLRQTVKDEKYKKFLEKYFRNLQIVPGPRRKIDVVYDKEDNKLFASAVSAKADYLISLDREVLNVGAFEGTQVVDPLEFWAIYKKQSDGDESSEWNDWTSMLLNK